MPANGLKVQIAVSVQLQKAPHNPSWGIRVLSSKTTSHFKKIKIYIIHKCLSSCTSSWMHVHNFTTTHYVIMLERSRVISSSSVYFEWPIVSLDKTLFLCWDRVEPFEAALKLKFGTSTHWPPFKSTIGWINYLGCVSQKHQKLKYIALKPMELWST